MKYVYFAQAYGSGSFGSCAYSEGSTAEGICVTGIGSGSSPAPGPAPSQGGGLADTGVAIIGLVTLACLIIFAGLVVRVWRRKPARSS